MTGEDTSGETDRAPKEFEGDLAGAVFWGADLRGARFRDVDLTGTRISHALVVDLEIDATIDAVVINGVDVTAYVNERDPWYPLRSKLRPTSAAEARAAWSALEAEWDVTVQQAAALPEDTVHASVDGEWSFVQTLRHLVFAIDKWLIVPILGDSFDPIGMPNSGSVDFPWPDLDQQLAPSFDEVRRVHADRAARVRSFLATFEDGDFTRSIEVLENGSTTVQDGVFTVLEEAFWHLRYARRDLERLGA